MQANIINLAEWHVTEPEIMGTDAYLSNTNAPDLAEDIRLCIFSGSRTMVLDCSALEYLTSAGMRMILSSAHLMWENGGRFSVQGLKGQPREMFYACGFDAIVPVEERDEVAVAA